MTFAPLDTVDLSTLRWTRLPGPVHQFQLMAGEAILADLTWARPHGSLATGESAQGRFTLKRAGFLHSHLTLRREGSVRDWARLTPAWKEHRIEIGPRAAFDFKRASVLLPAWTVLDPLDRTELIRIEPVREGRRLEGGICEVHPSARKLATLPMVLLLTWYFVVLAWFEDETVSEWADHAEGRF